jgi:hypothetical protein
MQRKIDRRGQAMARRSILIQLDAVRRADSSLV